MQAVILSAGKGTRLNPLTKSIPKVMVPINGKPLMLWNLKHLKRFGIKDIFINLHYLPDQITNYFKDGKKFGVSITYAYEKHLLGTGGGVAQFKKQLQKSFFLLYGDIFTNIDIEKLYKFHLAKRAEITVVVAKTDHPADSDLVSFSSDMRLQKIYFKPHKNLPKTPFGLSAVYIIESSLLPELSEKPFEFEKDFLSRLLKKGKSIFCYDTDEFVKDIGTPKRYKFVKREIRKMKLL